MSVNPRIFRRLLRRERHWHDGKRWTLRICQECGYTGPTEREGFHRHDDAVSYWMPEVVVIPARRQK
jgi:hypothetical protein